MIFPNSVAHEPMVHLSASGSLFSSILNSGRQPVLGVSSASVSHTALQLAVMFEMVPEEGERKLTLASAETLFSPAQKSIEELKGAMNLEQFRR